MTNYNCESTWPVVLGLIAFALPLSAQPLLTISIDETSSLVGQKVEQDFAYDPKNKKSRTGAIWRQR